MTTSQNKLGLLLGFIGMCLFAGTLPATRLAVSGFDPLFLTVTRARLQDQRGLLFLLSCGGAFHRDRSGSKYLEPQFARWSVFHCLQRSQ